MKPRPELTIESTKVMSNPNDFYIDSQGRVNELDDDEERILFGTVANPSAVGTYLDKQEALEDWLFKQAERDCKIACDSNLNPHLKVVNLIFDLFKK